MSGKRVPQPITRYEEPEPNNSWNKEDKVTLLKGLKKYGHVDITSLRKLLPHKSSTAIKMMIYNAMTAARRSTKYSKIPPIDMWLEQTAPDDTNSLIYQALLFISLFEKHPDPVNCDGCDLRAAYNFIYRITRNYPAIDLPPKTKKIIYKVISKTVSKMRLKSPERLLQFINNLYKSTSHKNYVRKSRTHQIGLCQVLEELNTFMVPNDQLRYRDMKL